VKDATAFVLTGGRSSRMGSDKALLSWAGETLLQHTLAIARDACGQVVICGARSLYGKFGEVIEDAEPGHGPLSGIQAALHATQSELNLILSVDVPLMTAEFLSWFLQQARSGEQRITAPEAQGRLQPLCAVYHRDVAGTVDEAMENGEFKVTRLFGRTTTRIITEPELHAAGFESSIFTNVNTPEDYKSLLQTASTQVAGGSTHV
jgi:molybdopterin-guanine dinucleotide biosynthesis protein A